MYMYTGAQLGNFVGGAGIFIIERMKLNMVLVQVKNVFSPYLETCP